MKIRIAVFLSLICSQIFACSTNNEFKQINNANTIANTDSTKMKITIGINVFSATLYNNATAKAFRATLPITIRMTTLNGNEKYFDLPNALPSKASNPGIIQSGDLMLYGGSTLVLFYKSFSTPHNYTQIGGIENPSGLATALGQGSVTVTFEAQ